MTSAWHILLYCTYFLSHSTIIETIEKQMKNASVWGQESAWSQLPPIWLRPRERLVLYRSLQWARPTHDWLIPVCKLSDWFAWILAFSLLSVYFHKTFGFISTIAIIHLSVILFLRKFLKSIAMFQLSHWMIRDHAHTHSFLDAAKLEDYNWDHALSCPQTDAFYCFSIVSIIVECERKYVQY